jgi:DNA modification methylase
LRDCSRQAGIVLDPFLGPGTTVIAAERNGRRGIEIDPVHVDVAIKRWQDYSSKTATLAATGETFEQIAQARAASEAAGAHHTRSSDIGEAE